MYVEIKGKEGFLNDCELWLDELEQTTAKVSLGLVKVIFTEIINTGPQYSGDFVASTKIGYGYPDISFSKYILGHGNRKASVDVAGGGGVGSVAAIAHASANASWGVPKLGTPVFISTNPEHDSKYAWKIEDGEIAFRPVNFGADAIYHKALTKAAVKYGNLNRSKVDYLTNLVGFAGSYYA